MEITAEKQKETNEALKKAIDEEITAPAANGFKARKLQGHVKVDIYRVEDQKKRGLAFCEKVNDEPIYLEAEFALKNNEAVATTHKFYVIAE